MILDTSDSVSESTLIAGTTYSSGITFHFDLLN